MKYINFIVVLYYLLNFCISSVAQSEEIRNFKKLNVNKFYNQLNMANNPLLIDVRTYSEYKKERLPNAMLVPTSKELYQITDIMDFEQPIFVHCDDSNRSASTCTLLIKKGFLKVYNLKEGLIGWKLY